MRNDEGAFAFTDERFNYKGRERVEFFGAERIAFTIVAPLPHLMVPVFRFA
jgi:hypothetical protein